MLRAVLCCLALCSKLDKTRAKKCDPGFKPVNNGDKVYFGGHGRVGISYIYKPASAYGSAYGSAMTEAVSYFDIKSGGVEPEDLLITGFFNGKADALHPNLPLTRLVYIFGAGFHRCERPLEKRALLLLLFAFMSPWGFAGLSCCSNIARLQHDITHEMHCQPCDAPEIGSRSDPNMVVVSLGSAFAASTFAHPWHVNVFCARAQCAIAH